MHLSFTDSGGMPMRPGFTMDCSLASRSMRTPALFRRHASPVRPFPSGCRVDWSGRGPAARGGRLLRQHGRGPPLARPARTGNRLLPDGPGSSARLPRGIEQSRPGLAVTRPARRGRRAVSRCARHLVPSLRWRRTTWARCCGSKAKHDEVAGGIPGRGRPRPSSVRRLAPTSARSWSIGATRKRGLGTARKRSGFGPTSRPATIISAMPIALSAIGPKLTPPMPSRFGSLPTYPRYTSIAAGRFVAMVSSRRPPPAFAAPSTLLPTM